MTYIASHVGQNNLRAACELAFQGLNMQQAVLIWGDNFGGRRLRSTCVKGLPSHFSLWRGELGSLERTNQKPERTSPFFYY